MIRSSFRGRDLIQKWEGIEDGNPSTVNLDPYLCPASYWTIGWGHVVRDGTGKMLKGALERNAAVAVYPHGITMDEARLLLAADLIPTENAVRRIVRADCTQLQFDAMVALCFNIGPTAFWGSSVASNHKSGQHQAAADSFLKWNKAKVGGRLTVLKGLTNRRTEERALYLEGTK